MKIDVHFGDYDQRLEADVGMVVLAIGLISRSDRPPFVSARVGGNLDGDRFVHGEYIEFENDEVTINVGSSTCSSSSTPSQQDRGREETRSEPSYVKAATLLSSECRRSPRTMDLAIRRRDHRVG
jgi:hypothetical protein